MNSISILKFALSASVLALCSQPALAAEPADETRNDARFTYSAASQERVHAPQTSDLSGSWMYLGQAIDGNLVYNLSGEYSPDGIINGYKFAANFQVVADAFGKGVTTFSTRTVEVKTSKVTNSTQALPVKLTALGAEIIHPQTGGQCQPKDICNLTSQNLLLCTRSTAESQYGCPQPNAVYAYRLFRKVTAAR